MQTFRDLYARRWEVPVGPAAADAVGSALGLSLRGLVEGDRGGLALLLSDRPTLLAVLWVLCSGQAAARGVGKDDFTAAALAVLDDAAAALAQALFDAYLPGEGLTVLRCPAAQRARMAILDRATKESFNFRRPKRKPKGPGRAGRDH